jgi:hypothetical protein
LINFAIGIGTNLSGNLTTTGTTLRNFAIGGDTNLSGNLGTTGSNLYSSILAITGYGINLSGNLTTTGQTLRNLTIGVGTNLSGNLTATGQNLLTTIFGGDTNTSGTLSSHVGLTTTAHGGIVASNDSRLTDSRVASDVYAWAKAATKPSYTKSEVGLGSVDNTADSSKSVSYAATAGAAPASDVYTWAKAATKPSYTYSEVGAVAAGMLASGAMTMDAQRLAGRCTAGIGIIEEIVLDDHSLGLDNFSSVMTLHLKGPCNTLTYLADAAGVLKNDGAGSFSWTTLGTIAPKNITVSTSDPGGTPGDGDLWVKYIP